jgi:uncharacterized membrane protein
MKVLIAGESWIQQATDIKGYDFCVACTYTEVVKWLRSALESAGIAVDYMPDHLALRDFPFEKSELMKYDVIIISDLGSNTLLLHPDTTSKSMIKGNRLLAIKEYVKDGGGFAMIGGYYSFQGVDGKARYRDTEIGEILPVEMLPYDDRVEMPQGARVEIIRKDHPVLSGIEGEWPLFLGYNKLMVRNEQAVLAKCGKDIFMAAQDYEKGRTLAFASDCAPHWGTPEFLEWKYYNKLWVNIAKWLAREI